MSNTTQILKDLGLSEDQIIDKVVGQIADQMLYGKIGDLDYDDVDSGGSTQFREAVDSLLRKRINQAVEDVAKKHTLPKMTEYIESVCLQKTNSWGEKIGEPQTFIEYLTERADTFLSEPVNYEGKTKAESRGSMSWSKKGTRVEYMIDRHLQYSISTALEKAVSAANESIIGGLKEAVNIKLGQISVDLKTTVKSK